MTEIVVATPVIPKRRWPRPTMPQLVWFTKLKTKILPAADPMTTVSSQGWLRGELGKAVAEKRDD